MTSSSPPTPTIHHQTEEYKEVTSICRTPNWVNNPSFYAVKGAEDGLDGAPLLNWYNFSVPRHDPLHVKSDRELTMALYDQIRPTNIVVVLAGMYVAHRKWIQREIDLAQELHKPILGVHPWGSQMTPAEVQRSAICVVGWNTNSIVDALRRLSI